MSTAFRQLHEHGLLVLPNAWDAGTARLIESLGAKAIATTSAGVAWARAYPDGDRLPVPQLLAMVQDITRAVRVPVTIDIEGGYSSDPQSVGETAARVADAGAAGINIEDGAGTPDLLCAKVEAIKRAPGDLFVNVRTDVYLAGLAPAEKRVEETIARAARYREAGADGIFVPGLREPAEIEAVVKAVQLPLNVMAWPGLPSASELELLGVRRLSAGAGISAMVFGVVASAAKAFLETGSIDLSGAMPFPQINGLFH